MRRIGEPGLLALALLFALVFLSVGVQCVRPASMPAYEKSLHGSPLSPVAMNVLSHVKYLANDKLEGRATGERGGELAAKYIADEFRKMKLRPAGDEPNNIGTVPAGEGDARAGENAYFQFFDATIGVSLGEGNSLKISYPQAESTYVCGEDFIPFSFSSTGTSSGRVTFAGYGISSQQYGYDDYARANLDGSIALVMRHEPGELDEASVFAGRTLTHYSDLRYKATNARDRGASAVIVTTDPLNHPDEEDELMPLQAREGLGDCGLPAIQVKRRIAEEILRAQGLDLKTLQKGIDSLLAPNLVRLSSVGISVTTDLTKERRRVANVIGVLEPSDRIVTEYVMVGAHYDHLGRGGEASLTKGGGIHNGADDNASGIAAMLELARILGEKRDSLKRGVIFLGFTGEELGVLGSTFYANNPAIPLEKTVLMLNLDTVGRLRDNKLYAAGTGSSPVLKDLITRANEKLSFEIESSEGGYGPSDHFPFYGHNVPVLFFFTGAHGDFHKVSDDWDKINIGGVSRIVELSANILTELVFTETPVPFTRVAADSAGPPGGEGYGRGSGVQFGIVPDFGGEPGAGARISGTTEGSPAEKAGLKAGDIIIKFDGKNVSSLYDLSYALREKKPGDEVEVVVFRGDRELTFRATLARRSAK